MQKITSRAQAIEAGETTYYTGEACGRGHTAARYVTSCGCVECLREDTERTRAKILERRKARAQQAGA